MTHTYQRKPGQRVATNDMPDDIGEETAKLRDMLKPKYHSVTEHGDTVRADLGQISVEFSESTNDHGVWISISVKSKYKGSAEDVMKMLTQVQAALRSL
jgi:hypothetical protein